MSVQPIDASTRPARRPWSRVLGLLFGLSLALVIPAVVSADPGDIGFEGPPGPGGAPSGSKPESKIWFNDGRWWASMYDVATSDFYIWVLDQTTDTWSRTNTRLDDRNSTRADVLWDGTKLYVASHNFSESDGSGTARLYRYSYNTSSDTYSLDAGFPATIASVRTETMVIAKDSTGQLWATWEANGSIWVNRSTTSDSSWGTPFAIPGAMSVNTDDISSIIAFGGNKVGVFWSDQSASPDSDFFAIHNDADGDTTWAIETAYSGTNVADDHINLKTDSSGHVYSLVKTSLTGANPLIVLLVRGPSGGWSNHTVSIASLDETRGILAVDEANGLLRVYVTSAVNGGTINERVTPIGSISFASGEGTTVIHDASAPNVNNATGSKQNATAETGLIIVAYNDTTRRYWHADILGGGPPPNTPPTANATSATTPQDSAVPVALSGSDSGTCELAFSIVSGPSHGSLGSIGGATCTSGSPNTDTASVTYTPTAGYSGPDSFTYRVNDGSLDSAPATASLTVTAGGDGTPPVRGATTVNGSTLSIAYDEPLDTGSVPATSAYAPMVNGSPRGVSNVAVAGSGVTLTLASPVVASDGVTLSYTPPGTNPVQDVAGNDAPSFTDATVTNQTPPPGGTTLTFTPTDDAQVRSSTPTSNFGSMVTIRLGGEGTATIYRTYLKFTVTGLTGPVTSVKLRLHASDASSNIVRVLPVTDTTWTEGALNWTNKPATGTPEHGSAPVPTLNAYNEITLSPSAVSGNGVVSFGLTIDGTNSAIFSSTEGANAPQLVVTQSGGPPPNTPPTANATSATTPQDSAVPVALSGSDSGTCELAFSIVSGPSHGSLGSIGGATCTSGSPNTDTASVTYTPTAGYSGPDSFTYRVNDGSLDSAPATASLTVTAGGDGTPPVRGATTVNGSTLSIAYDEPLDTGSVPATSAYAPMVNGSPRGVSNVAVAGSGVTLTLASPVVASDGVTLSYTPPGTNPVQDVAGNDAPSFTDATVTNQTPPPGGTTLTFTPTDDAQVRSSTPTSNFGSMVTIRLGGEGTATIYRTYLKFTVTGLTGPVTSVKLRLHASDASSNIVRVLPVTDTTWTEGALNWTNKPATGTPEHGSAPVPTLNAYNEITLSPSAVSGNGVVSFGLTIDGTNSAIFSSTEGANAPQLVVTQS